jgi:hypothetical protein
LKNDKTVTKVKRVIQANTALEIVLPVDFVRKTGLGKGDEVVVSYTDQVLTVIPNPNRMKDITKGEEEPDAVSQ